MKYNIEELREIVDLAKRRRYSDLEERWLELAEDPPDEIRFYDSMARALLKNEARDRLTELAPLMAGALVEKNRPAEAVALARTVWRYAPDLAALGEPTVEALRRLHGDRPNFQSFTVSAGLDRRSDLLRALARFEELLYCDEGEVFEHKTFGIGVVEEIDPDRKCVSIRFAAKAPKEFTFDGVREFLTKLQRSGFRGERVKNPETLKQRVFETGAEFARFVLQDYPDGLTQVDFKNLLLEDLMTREEWDRWWAANRSALRRDPYIDWGRGPRGLMRLRSEPKTYYEAMAEGFEEDDSSARRLASIAEAAKHIAEEAAPDGFADQLVSVLRSEFEGLGDDDVSAKLERVLLARAVGRALGEVALPAGFDERALLAQAENPAEVILAISHHDLQARALETIAASDRARANELAGRMLPHAPPRFAQWLLDWLVEHGDTSDAASALAQLLRSPDRNPDAFLWAARQFFAGKFAALSLEIEARDVIPELVRYIRDLQNRIDHRVANTPTLRGIQVKLKNLIAEHDFAILRHAILPLPVEDARALCKPFESHAAFPDAYLSSLRHAVHQARPDIEEGAQAAGADDIDDSVLYVTAESLRQRRRDLQHLRSIEIPKNSREIGEAASHGDLSENAEYEAARHRQVVLFRRAEELQTEIEKARPIDPNWVRTDCVWIGTRFEARNRQSGETETYTILGAWDSRPEDNVLSYLTPSAQQFLRKQVGQQVVIERPGTEPTEYEILRIESVLP